MHSDTSSEKRENEEASEPFPMSRDRFSLSVPRQIANES